MRIDKMAAGNTLFTRSRVCIGNKCEIGQISSKSDRLLPYSVLQVVGAAQGKGRTCTTRLRHYKKVVCELGSQNQPPKCASVYEEDAVFCQVCRHFSINNNRKVSPQEL